MRQHIDTTPHPPHPLHTPKKGRRTPCRISLPLCKTGGTPTRELPYKEVYPMNPPEVRKRIVQTYLQTGNYCETARRGNTSPQLVRKGVQRYQQHGEQGLQDQPTPPNTNPERPTPPSNSAGCNSTRKRATDADASPSKGFISPPTPSATSSDATRQRLPAPASRAVASILPTGRGKTKRPSRSSKPM